MEVVTELLDVLILTIIGICTLFGLFLRKHAKESKLCGLKENPKKEKQSKLNFQPGQTSEHKSESFSESQSMVI